MNVKYQPSRTVTRACAIRMRTCMLFALLIPGMLGVISVERADAASATAATKSAKPQSLINKSPLDEVMATKEPNAALASPLPTTQKTVPGVGKGTQTAPGLEHNPSPYRGGHPVSPSRPGNAGGYK